MTQIGGVSVHSTSVSSSGRTRTTELYWQYVSQDNFRVWNSAILSVRCIRSGYAAKWVNKTKRIYQNLHDQPGYNISHWYGSLAVRATCPENYRASSAYRINARVNIYTSSGGVGHMLAYN